MPETTREKNKKLYYFQIWRGNNFYVYIGVKFIVYNYFLFNKANPY